MKIVLSYIFAWIMFLHLFNSGQDFVPENVEILSIWLEDGVLTLNLSAEVMEYGGTYFEYRFVNLILETAATLPYPNYLTVLVEGVAQHLPEGVKVFRIPL